MFTYQVEIVIDLLCAFKGQSKPIPDFPFVFVVKQMSDFLDKNFNLRIVCLQNKLYIILLSICILPSIFHFADKMCRVSSLKATRQILIRLTACTV